MSISELTQKIIDFRNNRDWEQFHQIKDLIIGLEIEVSELSQLFLWKSEEEIKKIQSEDIENEIADIYIFLTYISEKFSVDLEEAVKKKIEINNIKYPVEKSFGSNKKYTEL